MAVTTRDCGSQSPCCDWRPRGSIQARPRKPGPAAAAAAGADWSPPRGWSPLLPPRLPRMLLGRRLCFTVPSPPMTVAACGRRRAWPSPPVVVASRDCRRPWSSPPVTVVAVAVAASDFGRPWPSPSITVLRWATSRFHPGTSEVTGTCCCCGRRGLLVSAEGMVSAAAAAAAQDATRPPPLVHRAGTLPGLHRLSAA